LLTAIYFIQKYYNTLYRAFVCMYQFCLHAHLWVKLHQDLMCRMRVKCDRIPATRAIRFGSNYLKLQCCNFMHHIAGPSIPLSTRPALPGPFQGDARRKAGGTKEIQGGSTCKTCAAPHNPGVHCLQGSSQRASHGSGRRAFLPLQS
jgi:hypothetical protein